MDSKTPEFYDWREDQAESGSTEVSSALLHCLSHSLPDYISSIRLFCDGCGGQNKNNHVVHTLTHWLRQSAPESIQNTLIVFSVRGHSFLPADRVFGRVEKLLQKRPLITTKRDLVKIGMTKRICTGTKEFWIQEGKELTNKMCLMMSCYSDLQRDHTLSVTQQVGVHQVATLNYSHQGFITDLRGGCCSVLGETSPNEAGGQQICVVPVTKSVFSSHRRLSTCSVCRNLRLPLPASQELHISRRTSEDRLRVRNNVVSSTWRALSASRDLPASTPGEFRSDINFRSSGPLRMSFGRATRGCAAKEERENYVWFPLQRRMASRLRWIYSDLSLSTAKSHFPQDLIFNPIISLTLTLVYTLHTPSKLSHLACSTPQLLAND
ncbi:hypothetical protein PR048_007032 [Dryococelus australis]|uniref:Uncharacterized protein n=1 Tax=Dryococelus australis TaxID=614101 RepID=A0ABQ9IDH8_9NEOP|nr:hypothetical protein PR048_007032 [Dryococelus australis]